MIKRVALTDLSPLLAEVLHSGGEVTLTVTGSSMSPLLRHRRDRVCLTKPPEIGLQKYDIPLFVRPDGKYVLHRIVAVKAGGYAVAGDNQTVREYPVRPEQVIGVVSGIWRGDKYIPCTDFRYRAYCRLWVAACPLRRLLAAGKHFLQRAFLYLKHRQRNSRHER